MHPRLAISKPARASLSKRPDALARDTSRAKLRDAAVSPPNDRTVRTAESVADAFDATAPCAAPSAENRAPVLRLNAAVTAAKETMAKPKTGASAGAMTERTRMVPRHSAAARNPLSRETFETHSWRTAPNSTLSVAASSAVSCASKKATRWTRSARKRWRRRWATTSSPREQTHLT